MTLRLKEMEMRIRKKLGFDMDEVLNNLVYQAVQIYNKTYRQNLNYYEIEQYDIRPYLVPQCKNIWREFCNEEFMLGLHVEPTAIETLNYLADKHEINFVTAGYPETETVRGQWLFSHFSFFKPNMLIMEREKQKWDGDLLMDDFQDNLLGGGYLGLLMNRPWNRMFDAEANGIKRVYTVADVLKYI
jgi:5'(3')-deoxyribonucleotidase